MFLREIKLEDANCRRKDARERFMTFW